MWSATAGPIVLKISGDIASSLAVTQSYPGARWLQSVAPDATIATRSDNWPGLVLAVKSGAGLGALLAFQGDSESDLICVIDDIDLMTPYYLLMHRDMQKTPRVRAFADFVAAEIKSFRALLSRDPGSPAQCSSP
jgi:DNA-binding transcriptional LysR family regulator